MTFPTFKLEMGSRFGCKERVLEMQCASIPPLCSLQFTASLMVSHQSLNTFVEFVFSSLICVPDSSPGAYFTKDFN